MTNVLTNTIDILIDKENIVEVEKVYNISKVCIILRKKKNIMKYLFALLL